jgi:hypothetical protein
MRQLRSICATCPWASMQLCTSALELVHHSMLWQGPPLLNQEWAMLRNSTARKTQEACVLPECMHQLQKGSQRFVTHSMSFKVRTKSALFRHETYPSRQSSFE